MDVIRNARLFGKNNKKMCVFMHGSSGFIPSNMWYIKQMVILGFRVLAPDHTVYCKECLGYSSSLKNFKRKNSRLPKLYKRIIELRMYELDVMIKFLVRLGHSDITIAGISEGAIVVSMYDKNVRSISKKIIISYSPERNYFNYDAGTPLKSHRSWRILNVIGDRDEYFGKTYSVASDIAGNYKMKRLNGNAGCTCLKKKYDCTVRVLTGTHDLTLNNKKRLKNILKEFVL